MIHGAFHPNTAVRLGTDMVRRGARIRARVRWTDPISRRRMSRSITVDSDAEAEDYFDLVRSRFGYSIDPLISFDSYARRIGDRFLRGVDMTSTAAGYRAGLRLRVLPVLGRLPVRRITAGIVDRTIDSWERTHSPSTIKNTIAALTRVLNEAVRDELISRNPMHDRASRRSHPKTHIQHANPVPGPADVERIAKACAAVYQSYSDHILLSAFLAARSSEVAGLVVGDVDWANKVVSMSASAFLAPVACLLNLRREVGNAVCRSSSRQNTCCADSRCNGPATSRCCVGRAAGSLRAQHCVVQPGGTSWLHHWGCRGCVATTYDMRAQRGSRTRASPSTSLVTSSDTRLSRPRVHTHTLTTPRCRMQ